MIQLALDPEGQGILIQVLESYLADLRMEIGHTDSFEYRRELKRKQQVLERIIGCAREQCSEEELAA